MIFGTIVAIATGWVLQRPRAAQRISYTHRSLEIDGEPTLWLAGSVHYPRFTPQMWPRAMELAKAGGLNAITTYVFWNLHEPVRGAAYDFSGRKNVSAFLQAAHDEGLYVHLRFGPYIDAEWDYGGFPWWLNSLGAATPKCLRCSDAQFEALMKKWLVDFIEEVRPFFASNGGPVAMVQIENELSCSNGREYTEWSIATALALDTGIPWSFCNNSASCVLPDTPGIIYTANAYAGADLWFDDGNYARYASQPAIWSEVEEGFDQWNMVGWNPQQPAALASHICRWFSRGGSGASYYMFNGGADYALTAGDDDATKVRGARSARARARSLSLFLRSLTHTHAHTRTTPLPHDTTASRSTPRTQPWSRFCRAQTSQSTRTLRRCTQCCAGTPRSSARRSPPLRRRCCPAGARRGSTPTPRSSSRSSTTP